MTRTWSSSGSKVVFGKVGKDSTIDKHQRIMYIVGLGVYPCQTFGTKSLHNLSRKYYEPLAAQPPVYRSAYVQR